jgi:response regulator of citrate/malate metabolism
MAEQNEIPKPFANNSVLLKLDASAKKLLEKKLKLIEDQKTKELILLDNYLKSLKSTEKQLKHLNKDQSDFSIKNMTKNITKECKLNKLIKTLPIWLKECLICSKTI